MDATQNNRSTQDFPTNHSFSNMISAVIGIPVKRILKVMLADENAKLHLREASILFQSSNGDKKSIEAEEKGLAHIIKSLASIIPNELLETKFWNAATSLVGTDISQFASSIKATKDNDVNDVAKTLKGKNNVWIASGSKLGDLTSQLLDGKVEQVTANIADGLTSGLAILASLRLQGSAIGNLEKGNSIQIAR